MQAGKEILTTEQQYNRLEYFGDLVHGFIKTFPEQIRYSQWIEYDGKQPVAIRINVSLFIPATRFEASVTRYMLIEWLTNPPIPLDQVAANFVGQLITGLGRNPHS